jgi:hypothetical protein
MRLTPTDARSRPCTRARAVCGAPGTERTDTMAKKAAKPAKPMKDLKTRSTTDTKVKGGGTGRGDQRIP